MELRHLRYLCAVAGNLSFTLAARQLHVSQSGVSGQVRELERELGVSLLRRNQREVRLTPEGAVFWEHAKEILSRSEQAMQVTRRTSQGDAGQLRIGLCGPVTALFLPKLVRRFRRRFPGVTLALRERSPSAQVGALLEGSIDIGFTRGVPVESRHLVDQIRLFREPVIAALPKSHPLSAQEAIPVSALATSRLVLYHRAGAPEIYDAILGMCQRAKFSPKLSDSPESWQAVLTMVEAGEGIALLPACVQHLRANDVVFRPLEGKGLQLDVIVISRRREPNATVERFLKLLHSALRNRPRAD
jgi:DNA-binding transcriptional LysR family regulator